MLRWTLREPVILYKMYCQSWFDKKYFGRGKRWIFWKRTFCPTEGIGWDFISDSVSLTVIMLCIGSLFSTQMFFITAETCYQSQVILIYATFQDTAKPNRRYRPWNLPSGKTWRLKTPNFDLFSPISSWDRMEVAKHRESMPRSYMGW